MSVIPKGHRSMKRSMKHVISFSALLVASSLTLTSCSAFVSEVKLTGDTKAPSLTTAPYTKESVTAATGSHYTPAVGLDPKTALAQLADLSGEGDIFLIATVTGEGVGENPIWQSEDRTTYSASVERINLVAEKYDLKIASYKLGYDELAPTLAENIKNYAYTADLLVVPASLAEELVKEDLVLNLSQTAFFDKTAYYFDSGITELYNDGDCYSVYGEALCDPESMLCVYYNTQKVSADIKSAVNGGTWTLDMLSTLGAQGGISSLLSLDLLVPFSCGRTYDEIFDKNGDPKKSEGDITEIVDTLQSVIGDKFSTTDDPTAFINGECAFYIGKMSDAEKLSKMSDRWSIAPIPVDKEGTSYPTVYDPFAEKWLFLVPRDAAISERSTLVMAALCAATCDELKMSVRDEIKKYVRSNETLVMLDKVLGIGNIG